jgi:hypothetical protein
VPTDTIKVPGAGQLRIQWAPPAGPVQDSRAASVTGR